jgi:hypothetical protein
MLDEPKLKAVHELWLGKDWHHGEAVMLVKTLKK